MPNNTIFWFRRDLRVEDNIGLYNAVKDSEHLLPVFIFEDSILKTIKPDNQRFGFLIDALKRLDGQLSKKGSYLHVTRGQAEKEIGKLIKKYGIDCLYLNKAHSHNSILQEQAVEQVCKKLNVGIRTFSDSLLVPVDRVPVRKVFTPFYKHWQKELEDYEPLKIKKIDSPKVRNTTITEALSKIDYAPNKHWDVDYVQKRIESFDFCNYDNTRNLPYIDGSSKMSPYIRFGIISIRQLYNYVKALCCPDDTYISELAWREFWYHMRRGREHQGDPGGQLGGPEHRPVRGGRP